ncbi:MAG: ACP S-malonyltransferase [Burkholderiaceae bacterium]
MSASIAFLFPGQGSQTVGMLGGFSDNNTVASVMDTASAALGEDLAAMVANGPAESLGLTVNTQPVMLACSVAFFEAYRAAGGRMPTHAAGHSLGEYAALTAAGVFSLADAVRTVRFRAEQMQAAVPVGTGGMAAILGLSASEVDQHCRAHSCAGAIVEAVNFNAPDQTVIAGHLPAVQAACDALKAAGAKRAILLPVSAPFHASLLEPAAQALEQRLAALSLGSPAFTVLHNVDVQPHAAAQDIRQALALQAMRPVRWVETIEALVAQGVQTMVECGPGKVLSGLVKRIAPEVRMLNILDQASLEQTLEATA